MLSRQKKCLLFPYFSLICDPVSLQRNTKYLKHATRQTLFTESVRPFCSTAGMARGVTPGAYHRATNVGEKEYSVQAANK